MAHNREGPDIVMAIRYAGVSEIRSVTDHELNRTEDGFSAIDPLRSHLNLILYGPSTQQEALTEMWGKGIRKPSQQAERPFVQMVISASPEFFRGDQLGRGQWDPEKLDAWVKKTMKWLRREYGHDLAHVALHLDEDTPHLHILVIPTYERKARRPSQRIKSGETDQEFADRVAVWEYEGAITWTAGRSSSPYWSQLWCRRDARKSYHAAVEDLGLGYGKDFIGADEPSPQRKTTGKWVREEADRLATQAADLGRREVELNNRSEYLDLREAQINNQILAAASDAVALAARTMAGVITGKTVLADDGRWTVPSSDRPALKQIWKVLRPALEAIHSWWSNAQGLVDALSDPDREVLMASIAPPENAVDDRMGPEF